MKRKKTDEPNEKITTTVLTDSDLRCPYCFKPAFANTVSPPGVEIEILPGSHTFCAECLHVIVFDLDHLGLLIRKPEPSQDEHAWTLESELAKFGERFGERNYKGYTWPDQKN